VLLSALAVHVIVGQEPPPRPLGGAYSTLGERRQRFVDDWVSRFAKVTGQSVEPPLFYDDILSLSTKTTFDAVTHALMTTPLTDASGQKFGDGLTLIERVDSVKGEVSGAPSDHQFRMYARLTANAREMLDRSREFKRGIDNSIYHQGYPVNYRERRGTPSIQVSIALDGRQADIDVDYRSSIFPVSLLNGHLSASNSDVRAGNNADRHAAQWLGFQQWWRGFFGVRLDRPPDAALNPTSTFALPKIPRAGKKDIKVMVPDFLRAWLVEGDVVAAMGYVSERSYACLAQDAPDPSAYDRGLAPFQIMVNLKAAHDAIGKHTSLEGLTLGVPLTIRGLRAVSHPQQDQFALYSASEDVAATFDCERRLTPAAMKGGGAYGQHYGVTFRIAGQAKNASIALLWAKDDGYWKIVSWQTEPEPDKTPAVPTPPEPKLARIKADLNLVQAAKDFMESWLVRKNYDAAFRYLSTRSYGCYDLVRGPDAPASASPDDAGRKIRAGLERIGQEVGTSRNLEAIVEAAEPRHPSIQVMDQPYSRMFSLTSFPSALGDAVECDARARGAVPPDPVPLDYGNAFGMTLRFRTQGGDAPVLRLLWRKEDGAWRISAYDIELP